MIVDSQRKILIYLYENNWYPFFSQEIDDEKKNISESIIHFENFLDDIKEAGEVFNMNVIVIKFIKFIEFSVSDAYSKFTVINLLEILR